MPGKSSELQFVTLITSVGLFIASLFTTAFCTDNGCRISLEAFLLGWLAMLTGGAAISWLANLFLITSWLLLAKNNRSAWLYALAATLFSVSFFGFKTIIEDEAGHYSQITSVGPGCWLWIASCVAALASGLILKRLHSNQTNLKF